MRVRWVVVVLLLIFTLVAAAPVAAMLSGLGDITLLREPISIPTGWAFLVLALVSAVPSALFLAALGWLERAQVDTSRQFQTRVDQQDVLIGKLRTQNTQTEQRARELEGRAREQQADAEQTSARLTQQLAAARSDLGTQLGDLKAKHEAELARLQDRLVVEVEDVKVTSAEQIERLQAQLRDADNAHSTELAFVRAQVEADEQRIRAEANREIGEANAQLRNIEPLILEKEHAARDAEIHQRRQFQQRLWHEVSKLLTVIKLTADNLAINDDQEARTIILDQVKGRVDELGRLVKRLSDVADIATGRAKLRFVPLDVAELVEEVVREVRVRQEATTRRIEVFVQDVPTPLPPVRADEQLLGNVLHNLLDNALKYTSVDGSIQVHAVQDDDAVTIRVTDNGIGIPPEDLPELGREFRRGRNVGDRPGFGIGLALTYAIIEAHEGEIVIDSPNMRGTVVVLRLPVYQAGDGAVSLPEN